MSARRAAARSARSPNGWKRPAIRVYYAEVDLGIAAAGSGCSRGRTRIAETARADAARLKTSVAGAEARIVPAGIAIGPRAGVARASPIRSRTASGIEP